MPPQVSVIIPTLNEAQNLVRLLPRIDAALGNRPGGYEVIVVDDNSTDGTPEVCQRLREGDRFPLTLHVRDEPHAGLSGAVLFGMELAAGEILVVMDADLQHPPEQLPELVRCARTGDTDFVIGSRYAPGGSTAGRWGPLRRLNSRVATLLARPFAG